MSKVRFRAALPLIAAATLGPLVAGVVAAQSTARDSSGVRLTPIMLRGGTNALRLASTPAFDIGGQTGDSLYEFNHVRGLVRLHDGTIVVANGNPQQLRFFDSHGRLVRTAGRKGSGPGEFQSPTRLFSLRGDTLVVFDSPGRRIVLFAANGTHLSTHALTPPGDRREPAIIGAFADQRLLAGSSDVQTVPPRPLPYYFGQHAFVYGLDGRAGSDIGPFGEGEHFVQHTVPEFGNIAYWDLAFGRQTTIAARGNDILVGDGSTFELKAYSRAGALIEVLRAATTPERLTDAERSAYRENELKGLAPRERAIAVKMVDEMPYPKLLPSFKRFFVADDGRIWIQRYPHVAESQERWIILDARGRFLDELALPAGFRLWAAGVGYALGVYRDEDDVEHVRQYALASR